MRIVRFIIIFFISILLLILALVNRQYVDFRFLPIKLSDPTLELMFQPFRRRHRSARMKPLEGDSRP